ncbi:MAG: PAS domain S-box protein [Chitinispirillaceae bacterium]|nr:PAS domain S-box protein [Chitinispirillaceae bacterium]
MTTDTLEQRTLPARLVEPLQKAFVDFQLRAERLQQAYEAMREDFKNVNIELDKKNTELQQSLAVREEMQTYLNSILESMDNGVIGVDTKGVITHFNRAAADITGFSPQEVLGRPYGTIFGRAMDHEGILLKVLHTGRPSKRDEKVVWRKDGHPVPVSFQSAPLQDRSGTCLGAVEIFTDVSKIKALEGEMQQARTMAALGEMSAAVAHEIRNPLGAMGMWAELLERDLQPNDTRSRTLKKIIEGLSRLNKIVSNLLVYTRPVKADFRKVQLEILLEEVIDYIEIEIERLGHAITVSRAWDRKKKTFVLADPEKMEQVIMNLCLNAIQAMPQGGGLTVAIEKPPHKDHEFIGFSIKDTGTGIARDHIKKIFDPFFTTRENGTGLGLAIVKKFVESHRGYINAESKPGKGTALRVFIPRLKE